MPCWRWLYRARALGSAKNPGWFPFHSAPPTSNRPTSSNDSMLAWIEYARPRRSTTLKGRRDERPDHPGACS